MGGHAVVGFVFVFACTLAPTLVYLFSGPRRGVALTVDVHVSVLQHTDTMSSRPRVIPPPRAQPCVVLRHACVALSSRVPLRRDRFAALQRQRTLCSQPACHCVQTACRCGAAAPMCIVFAAADGCVVSSPAAPHQHPQSGSVVPSRGTPPESRCSAMSSSIQPPSAAAATLPPWRCPQPTVPPPAAAAASAVPSPVEVKKRAAAAAPTHAKKKQDTGKWKIVYGLMADAIMRRDMDAALTLAVEWYVDPTAKTKRNAAAAASEASSSARSSSEWL